MTPTGTPAMDTAASADTPKVKTLTASRSPAAAYRALQYGDMPLAKAVLAELLFFFLGSMPGAAGLWLRKKCYPCLFRSCGRGVVFGRNLILRHPHKISLGDGVILDDGATLDAKGTTNRGISLGDRVYIGRQSTVYTKNGDISIGDNVSVSALAILFSSNDLVLEKDTVVASYVYILSGGEYDPADPTPYTFQTGTKTRGPLRIGEGCWIGTGAKILDAASSIGARAIVAAGAVVVRPVPPAHVALGVPARNRPLPPPPAS
jgi:acetyltransferase-like isoleucine patch superfamily enzyme